MIMNRSGKVATIFLVIFVTLISFFFFNNEVERREALEKDLKSVRVDLAQLDTKLKDTEKQKFLLEEKNKEADEKINSLLDELELEAGLREELKVENSSLKQKMDEQAKAQEDLKAKLTKNIQETEGKVTDLQKRLDEEMVKLQEKETQQKSLEDKIAQLESQVQEFKTVRESANVGDQSALKSSSLMAENQDLDGEFSSVNSAVALNKPSGAKLLSADVELDPIVVSPNPQMAMIDVQPVRAPEGRVLSVDVETEFVIINLGSKDGIRIGDYMSVYRGQEFLGDVKVTRVQDEMAAADLIPPFSSRRVRKNDQVVLSENVDQALVEQIENL